MSISEPPRWTWRSIFMTFVYMTSFTWQAFTWRNYCMLHDFMKSISMKCICMIKVTNRWWNKTMIHINTQPNNIYMTTHKHEYHPHETKEQLYDVQLHDVANTWFVPTVGGAMRTLLIILCYFHVWPRIFSSSLEEVAGSWAGKGLEDGGEGALARHRPGTEIILNWILW